jgi:hypothetical protein
MVFEKRLLRIFGLRDRRYEMIEEKLHNEELQNFYFLPNITR